MVCGYSLLTMQSYLSLITKTKKTVKSCLCAEFQLTLHKIGCARHNSNKFDSALAFAIFA